MLATFWHLDKRGLTLGDVEMKSPECDWTSGLPFDWIAFHRHDDEASIKELAAQTLTAQELERFSTPGIGHTESGVL